MTRCTSIDDRSGYQCDSEDDHGMHNRLHIHEEGRGAEARTIYLWNDKESRAHMQAERDFFERADRLAAESGWSDDEYQDVIRELLVRVRSQQK